jgi:putative spermidine/putrescine transport system permease protein
MALPPYMTTPKRSPYYGLRIFVGLVLLFLIAPILAIMPLSFNSESFSAIPCPGFPCRWYTGESMAFTDPGGPAR